MPTERQPPGPEPPDRPPYIQLAHPAMGAVVLRVPSALMAGRLAGLVSDEQRETIALLQGLQQGIADADTDRVGQLWQMVQGSVEALSILGALVGLSWADPRWALDAVAPPREEQTTETVLAYGAAVYEELYEAGWTLAQLIQAATVLYRHMSSAFALFEEGRARADFSQPRTEPAPSPSGGSRSSYSGAASARSTPLSAIYRSISWAFSSFGRGSRERSKAGSTDSGTGTASPPKALSGPSPGG